MVRVLISTGEVSGDLQGSLLVSALHRQAARRGLSLEVMALGGPRMEAAGAELLADTAPMGSIGLLEALPLVLPTLRLQARVNRELTARPPDAVVLIDYMGANVRLGQRLRRTLPEIPITYYIAPQEWAWRMNDGGTSSLLSFTDRILAIFPEEASFYASHGADVTWVGHPLLDLAAARPDRSAACQQLGLNPDARLLLLLPASRIQELRYLMPVLAEVAARLQACSDLSQHRHQVAKFLDPGGRQEKKQTCVWIQSQLLTGRGAIRARGCEIEQRMPDPGDIGPMGCIEGRLLWKDRENPVREAEETARPAIIHPPGPFLRGDVIRDGDLWQRATQALTEANIGPHVINQHHRIRRTRRELSVDPGLKSQGGEHQRQRLQETDRPHRGRICQQLSTGGFHSGPAKGHHLKGETPPSRLAVQRRHQETSLQITGDFTGADQYTHHQRCAAGIGPRRPLAMEASRKPQRWSAAGSRGCSRARPTASAITWSER